MGASASAGSLGGGGINGMGMGAIPMGVSLSGGAGGGGGGGAANGVGYQTSGHAVDVVSDVLGKLLTVGIADPGTSAWCNLS
jgi:hypothetical protein